MATRTRVILLAVVISFYLPADQVAVFGAENQNLYKLTGPVLGFGLETNGTVDFAKMAEAVTVRFKNRIGFTPIVKVVENGVLPRSEKKSKRVIDERYE